MSKPELLYSQNKGNWFVDLWSDGTIEVFSTYKNQVNITHCLDARKAIGNSEGIYPSYLFMMLFRARFEWSKVNKVGVLS